MAKKYNRYTFIWKAIQKHGYIYDYRKVEYIDSQTKVCIICPEHGEFWQTPQHHLRGCKCQKCSKNYLYGTKEFIEKANKIHKEKYSYSKINYINSQKKVCIICPEHGEFWQTPANHLQGQGCPKCDGSYKFTFDEFIEKANKIHGKKYDYSNSYYVNCDVKVCIICPKHGEFWQTPYTHINGCGCPICNESHLERETAMFLDEYNIKYERQKRFDWLGRQSLDFYLPDFNIAIECQGEQHFKPIKHFGGEERFKKVIGRDNKKLKLCNENNIDIFYINYNNNIKDLNNVKNTILWNTLPIYINRDNKNIR
uniref:Restriction enzyme n=1 Tax=Myoviridae sp. ctPuP5 TaxID=2823543 RepID=A0A8S5L988_9CAUD|nr:MAG TPA: restriction enzyme [Myoviridae sp. ctPuP5]